MRCLFKQGEEGFTTEMARRPLLLEEGLVQYDGFCGYEYRRDPFYGWLLLQKCPGEDWKPSLGFTQEPQIDLDFETPMFYYAYEWEKVHVTEKKIGICRKSA